MEAVFGILNHPIALAVIGFILARFPGIRAVVANRYIPFLQTAVAWLAMAFAPGPAHAAGGPFALDGPLLGVIGISGFLGLTGPFFAGLGSAIWQTTQAHLFYKLFGHKMLGPDPRDSRQ
jgi:hypothetical protein